MSHAPDNPTARAFFALWPSVAESGMMGYRVLARFPLKDLDVLCDSVVGFILL